MTLSDFLWGVAGNVLGFMLGIAVTRFFGFKWSVTFEPWWRK